MENQIENNTTNDEEISLIDLFAVLLRYRKLIVIGTLAVSFLAGVYLFVIPAVFPSLSGAKYVVSYTIDVQSLPSVLNSEFAGASSNRDYVGLLAVNYFKDPQKLAALYSEHPIFSADGKLPDSKIEFTKMVSDFFGKEITVNTNTNTNTNTNIKISLVVPVVHEDKVDSFMNAFIASVNKDISGYVLPRLTALVSAAEATLAKEKLVAAEGLGDSQNLQLFVTTGNRYLTGDVSFVYQSGEPFVVPSSQGRTLKLIIACFAAFFVMVFAAFVLNAVRNIKEDPQASKVISDAWKAGK